jgi:hypothetical protein
MKGKLEDVPTGKGMKWVLGQVTIEPRVEALHTNAKWLDMKSMKAIYPLGGPTIGSQWIGVNLVGPGSVGNYASFSLIRIYETNATNNGTAACADSNGNSGTLTSIMLIVGE